MTDVLIAGAGPTGLAAAVFLHERGITARVIEKESYPSQYSKAFGVNPRTLALLESSGVTERLLESGWRMSAINIWRNGRRLFRLNLANIDHRFPFMLVNSQAKTEALLAEVLKEHGIGVERTVTLAEVTTAGTTARAALTHASGRDETVIADYLLGADGSRSTVRSSLGIGFSGTTYPERWQLYDLELNTSLAPHEAHAFVLDDGGMFAVRLHHNVWRVLGNVPNLPDRLPPGTQPGAIEWASDFGISHRYADRFQVGRVSLAGDAAHIHSGLGARGMNLGIEDAFVFATLVAEARVEDYERLRRPVVARVIHHIERMTEVPRGVTLLAKMARLFMPVLAPIIPLGANNIGRFVMGLDHEVLLA